MEEQLGEKFFINGLCLHCNLAQDELKNFEHFHSETETAWKRKDDNLQSELDETLKKYPEEHHQDIVESHGWELHLNQSKYPSMHRESILITLYNFLENQLNQLCKIISESIDSDIKLKDLYGQGINRAFLYLSKVANFDLTKMGGELSNIKSVNLLRNQIVHNGGFLPEEPAHKLNKFISQQSNLAGSPGNTIIIRAEFINEFIEKLSDFFEKLDIEVQKFMGEAMGKANA